MIARRTIAYLIDSSLAFLLVMILLQWAILSKIRDQFGITEDWFHSALNTEIYVLLTISLPVWLYFVLGDSRKFGRTLGKQLMGLKVCKSGTLEPISLGRSFLRTAAKLLPWEVIHLGLVFPEPIYFQGDPEIGWLAIAGMIWFLLNFLSLFAGDGKQSLYDNWLQTQVIRFPA